MPGIVSLICEKDVNISKIRESKHCFVMVNPIPALVLKGHNISIETTLGHLEIMIFDGIYRKSSYLFYAVVE